MNDWIELGGCHGYGNPIYLKASDIRYIRDNGAHNTARCTIFLRDGVEVDVVDSIEYVRKQIDNAGTPDPDETK